MYVYIPGYIYIYISGSSGSYKRVVKNFVNKKTIFIQTILRLQSKESKYTMAI